MFTGWSDESDMPATYVHLSNEDLNNHVFDNYSYTTLQFIEYQVFLN